jgi:hypothetical protein
MSNPVCFFVSDLHGKPDRYAKLFVAIEDERPQAVFLGGDLLPHRWAARLGGEDFIADVVKSGMTKMRDALGSDAPRVFIILGNDDDRTSETAFLEGDSEGLWEYIHERWVSIGSHELLGYANVPPTPFLLKDWERYDVSRYTGPGCVSPEEGQHTVLVNPDLLRFGTTGWRTAGISPRRSCFSTRRLIRPTSIELDSMERPSIMSRSMSMSAAWRSSGLSRTGSRC